MNTERARVPGRVFLLGVGIFCLGTSEFMVAGLLPEISAELGVSVPAASTLVSAFALGMIIGAPAMAVGTLTLPRRTVLIGSLIFFTAMHVVAALSGNFAVIAGTRLLAAFACGAFWAVGAVVAVRSSPGAAGKALAVVAGGLTLSYVAGVPIGTWIGQMWGWRAAFWAVAAATLLIAPLIAMFVPGGSESSEHTSLAERLRPEIAVFRAPRVWLTLAITALFQAGLIATFTFLAPLLTDVTGLDSSAVPVILLIFGIGSLVGITLGGTLADRSIFGTMFLGLGGMLGALVLLGLTAPLPVPTIVSVALLGIFAYMLAPTLNARVFGIAGDAPTLASAVNTSAFNVGNFLGPVAGALVAEQSGFRAPISVSLGLTAAALVLALVARATDRPAAPEAAPATTTPEDSTRDEFVQGARSL